MGSLSFYFLRVTGTVLSTRVTEEIYKFCSLLDTTSLRSSWIHSPASFQNTNTAAPCTPHVLSTTNSRPYPEQINTRLKGSLPNAPSSCPFPTRPPWRLLILYQGVGHTRPSRTRSHTYSIWTINPLGPETSLPHRTLVTAVNTGP